MNSSLHLKQKTVSVLLTHPVPTLLPIVTTVAARREEEEKGEKEGEGRAMKIVNLISIDIESAAASDVANNAAKTRLEFHLFDFTLPRSLSGNRHSILYSLPQLMAVFFLQPSDRERYHYTTVR